MFNFLKNLFRKKRTEWYCTYCGHAEFSHDAQGRLIGACPEGHCPCPLDIRTVS